MAFGALGCEPDQVIEVSGDDVSIEFLLNLRPLEDGSFQPHGQRVLGGTGQSTVLQWGTRSRSGLFLIFDGLEVRMPVITAAHLGAGSGRRLVLTGTFRLTDATGAPRRGVVEADDAAWQYTLRAAGARRPPAAVASRRG